MRFHRKLWIVSGLGGGLISRGVSCEVCNCLGAQCVSDNTREYEGFICNNLSARVVRDAVVAQSEPIVIDCAPQRSIETHQ